MVSVLNPNSRRRKNPRWDYEAEMNSISVTENREEIKTL